MVTATTTDGKARATFEELSLAVARFCDSYCEIPNINAVDCSEWPEKCPLYPYRKGAIEAQ